MKGKDNFCRKTRIQNQLCSVHCNYQAFLKKREGQDTKIDTKIKSAVVRGRQIGHRRSNKTSVNKPKL